MASQKLLRLEDDPTSSPCSPVLWALAKRSALSAQADRSFPEGELEIWRSAWCCWVVFGHSACSFTWAVVCSLKSSQRRGLSLSSCLLTYRLHQCWVGTFPSSGPDKRMRHQPLSGDKQVLQESMKANKQLLKKRKKGWCSSVLFSFKRRKDRCRGKWHLEM